MGASLRALWGATFILLVRLSQLCEARVNTEIQMGPLYRVVDTELSISCKASGYPVEERTDFEFRMIRLSRPDWSINIISSGDPDYGYATHSRRVANKDIVLTHQSNSEALFVIKKLLKEDEGEYECISVTKETVLAGTFSAKTNVKVIDDSLSVSLRDSATSMSFKEGEPLSVTCQASSDTLQHTHLSVVWFLHKEGAQHPQPIISLSKDFTLIPGGDFKQRYTEGAINLDKIGEATYRLEITELQLSDQGQIYCQAQEWILDPDRSWYSINQKDTEKIDLTVKAREVGPDMLSLVVKISSEKTLLLEGQELLVSCSIDTQNLKERFFSVAWFQGDIELIRIGPTGILSVSLDDQRVEKGGLRAVRIGDGDYRFSLKPVSKDDQGSYNCKAWPEDRGSDGVFTKGTPQSSNGLQITISVPESRLSVKMHNLSLNVNQLDKLTLVCKVAGAGEHLSVNWDYKSATSSTFTNIISLESDGVVTKNGMFKDRKVRATRPSSDSFEFELEKVTLTDTGRYKCHVLEKRTNQDFNSDASDCDVTVKPLESLLKVSLTSRSISPTIGDEVVLMCRVKGPLIPISVTWIKLGEDLVIDEIVKLNYNGDISWSGNQKSYQVSVRNQKDSVIYELKLTSASQIEKGAYRCSVSTFVEGAHKKLATSNDLDVAVRNPETKFELDLNPTIKEMINTDLHMKCLFKRSSLLYAYSANWFLQRDKGYINISSADRNALVSYGNVGDLNHGQRISMACTEDAFELVIRQAKISDSGLYVCNVTEWLRDPRGFWISLSTLTMTTNVTISEPKTNLTIEKSQLKELNVSRDKNFAIPCVLTHQSSPESKFQVTWFWQNSDKRKAIFTAYRNSTLQRSFKEVDLLFDHPKESSFSLTVLKPRPEHSGLYFCEVEEWLPSLPEKWRRVYVTKSDNLNVTVFGEAGEAVPALEHFQVPLIVIVIILLVIIVILVILICRNKGQGTKKKESTLWAEQGQHIRLDPD